MTIQSSIRELGVFDLFQILHLHRKTGRLVVTNIPDGREAHVFFKEGSVCFARFHEGGLKSAVMLLLDWGILDQSALERIEENSKNYDNIFDCLEGEGIASRTYIENFVASRVRETVYEIFKLEEGDCEFIEEQRDERRELIVPLNTENLILEAARRIDEWSNIESKVPSSQSVFSICFKNVEEQQLNLKPREWELLSLVDGVRTVEEINEGVGEDLFSTSKLIYGLVVMGVIGLVEKEEKRSDGDIIESVEELLRSGKEAYNKLNLESAADMFEKVLKIDPDSFEAHRMLGEIYYKMDRMNDALAHLRTARSLNPENQKTMFIMGYLHARLGEVSKAIVEWEELKKRTENHKIQELVKSRISIARKWEKVLQEY